MQYKLSSTEKKLLSLSTFVLFIVLYVNEGWLRHPDSYVYVSHLDFIIGDGEEPNNINPRLLLRPLIFYLSYPFYFLFGSENAIGVLNSFFYLSSSIIFYRFVLNLFDDKELAFFSSIYFITAFPVLYWGLGILADMGTWFFLLLCLLILQDRKPELKNIYDILIPVLIGFGILYKFDILAIPLFVTLSLFHRFSLSDFPLKYFIASSILVSLPIIINQIYVNQIYGFNYYTHFILEIISDSPTTDDVDLDDNYSFKYTQTYRLLTFFIAFPLLVPFSFLGLRHLKNVNDNNYYYSLFFIFSSLIIILGWGSSFNYIGAGSPRYAFLLFPIVIPLTIIGLRNTINDLIIKVEFLRRFDANNFFLFFIILFYFANLFVAIYSSEVRKYLNIWEW